MIGNLNDDWTVDWVGCQNLKIVQTGRYNNYITARVTGWPGEYELEFSNNSNIPLLIGGYVYLEFRREWRPFTTVVEAYGKNSVGSLFSGSVTNYEIHFVEQP